MKRYTTEAVVLRNTNYKDSNKIYTLLTEDRGKITAIARGVRKLSSRRAGNLDTLNHIQVSLTEDIKGYKTITEVKTLNSNKHIKQDLKKTFYGLKMLSLIDKSLSEGHEEKAIFVLLLEVISRLDAEINTLDTVLLYFELRLLGLLGIGIDPSLLGRNYPTLMNITEKIKDNYRSVQLTKGDIAKLLNVVDRVFANETSQKTNEAVFKLLIQK